NREDNLAEYISKLNKAEEMQIANYEKVMKELREMKDNLLINAKKLSKTQWSILQYCIYPRILISSVDALYCAKFIELLHNLNTKYFSSILLIYNIVSGAGNWVTSCTEEES